MSSKFGVVCNVIVADQPTINGHIYPRHLLEKFVEQCNSVDEVFVTTDFQDYSVNLSKVIGRATQFQMTASGTIAATLELLPFDYWPPAETTRKFLEVLDFSPMVIGGLDENGVVADDAKVAYFALTPKDPAVPRE